MQEEGKESLGLKARSKPTMPFTLLFVLSQSCHSNGHCRWQSREGVWFSLKDLLNKQFQVSLQNPKGSILKFQLCTHPAPQILCKNGVSTPACITVPGVPPSSTGKTLLIEQLEPNIPSMGIRLVYEDGDICEVTKIPRRTIVKIPCNQRAIFSSQNFAPQRAWEGKGREVCHYFVEFPASKFGCPTELEGSPATDQSNQLHVDTVTTFSHDHRHQQSTPERPVPEIMAVTGCVDSDPARTTRECHFAGKINLVLHGINFHALCNTPSPSISTTCINDFSRQFCVLIGGVECSRVSLVSQYQINCTVEKASGSDRDVVLKKRYLTSGVGGELGMVGREAEPAGVSGEESGGEVVIAFGGAVSFKERIDYRERFDKFVDMGVGGMKREIDELYRRAFASRGQRVIVCPPPCLLESGMLV